MFRLFRKRQPRRVESELEKQRAIAEANERALDDWLRNGKVPMPEGGVEEWIKDQTRETWHNIACHYNWGFEPEKVLGWIVAQPECDASTAMTVFLAGEPYYYNGFASEDEIPSSNRRTFDMLKVIAENFSRGFYTRNDFFVEESWNPDMFRNHQKECLQRGEKLLLVLPEAAFEKPAGRAPKSDYCTMDGDVFYNQDVWERMQGRSAVT